MKRYVQIINEDTKQVSLGMGTNTTFYKSIGMQEMEVEQAYNGQWYVAGYAPTKSDDEQALEGLQKEQTSLEAQIEQLKDQFLIATLANDTEQVAAIKAEYQNLVGV